MIFEKLNLTNKTALVSGGASGIGFATAELLMARGATVTITGRDQSRLDTAAERLPGLQTIRSDSAKMDDIELLAKHFEDANTLLDIVVLNAGITPFAPLGRWNAEKFDGLFATNVRGPWMTIQALSTHLSEGASIVSVGSTAGTRGGAATAVYGSTKAALALITKGLVPTLADKKIRVNTVSPGPIDTPAWGKTGLPNDVIEKVKTDRAAANPLKRYGHPAEVAEVIAFLSSPAASFVSGIELTVDGGLLAT